MTLFSEVDLAEISWSVQPFACSDSDLLKPPNPRFKYLETLTIPLFQLGFSNFGQQSNPLVAVRRLTYPSTPTFLLHHLWLLTPTALESSCYYSLLGIIWSSKPIPPPSRPHKKLSTKKSKALKRSLLTFILYFSVWTLFMGKITSLGIIFTWYSCIDLFLWITSFSSQKG